jgi:hypothetical protein
VGYLSESTRRAVAGVLLVIGVVVGALAITDTAFFEDPPSPEERVARTVTDFFEAAAAADFDRSCDLLSPNAQMQMQVSAAAITGEDRKLKCPEILDVLAKDLFADVEVRVRSVNIEGNRARAETTVKAEGEPSSIRQIPLEQADDGSWVISDFG